MCEHDLSKKCWCNPTIEDYRKKPIVKFCWDCGKKLWGNHHVIKNIDGYPRTLHKQCAKKYD